MEETASGIDGHSRGRGSGASGLEAPPSPVVRVLTLLLLGLSASAFFIAAPGGVLGKADLVGYAVCHQIAAHSFTMGGRPLPLCARCTGMFVGALVGLFGQAVVLRRGRAAQFPPTKVLVFLAFFTLVWIGDGANSFLLTAGGPRLYAPTNGLRLVTGALNGVTVSALVYPIFNLGLWRVPMDIRTLRGLGDLGVLVFLVGSFAAPVLSGWDALLYPVALLSAVGVLALLTSVNSVIVLIVLRRENSVGTWSQGIWFMALGLAVSLVQIGALALVRYGLTGTLEGFTPL